MQKKASVLAEATLMRREGVNGPNRIQLPDPDCDYRRTDFVELTAPLLKSSVPLGTEVKGMKSRQSRNCSG